MTRVMLVNPHYYDDIFTRSRVRAAILPGTTPLGLLCVAAPLVRDGHPVRIVDLNVAPSPNERLAHELSEFKPEVVGITATTPLIHKAYHIAEQAKRFNPETLVIAGGPHASAMPREVLGESAIDCAVRGEGDFVLSRIVSEGLSTAIPNLHFKRDGETVASPSQDAFVQDIDALPPTPYDLLDIGRYRQPRISSRTSPVGYYETSRGCFARCVFCNKNIHGYKVRMKSVARVVDDMERMLKLGFREIQIIDDIFTADMDRARAVCEEIMRRRLRFPWYPRGGLRVDRVEPGLLRMMRRAGCYRIPFGIESGSQRVLDVIRKKITLDQARNAVRWAKAAGLQTECYFMLGLPSETEEDLKRTIEFAIELDPDYAKFATTIPLPGTPMFDSMKAAGRIKTTDWKKYNFSTSPKELYDHDVLPWQTLERYETASYRRFYFRSFYVLKTLLKTADAGTLMQHARAFLKTRW
ncbi:MAG: radical SAM protein [Planctomycetota bacterium]|nr:radical SAM protein [Planctomycetota bacterium]